MSLSPVLWCMVYISLRMSVCKLRCPPWTRWRPDPIAVRKSSALRDFARWQHYSIISKAIWFTHCSLKMRKTKKKMSSRIAMIRVTNKTNYERNLLDKMARKRILHFFMNNEVEIRVEYSCNLHFSP